MNRIGTLEYNIQDLRHFASSIDWEIDEPQAMPF